MDTLKSVAPIVLLLLAATASAEANGIIVSAPEPASWLLIGGGLVGLVALRRRRSRRS